MQTFNPNSWRNQEANTGKAYQRRLNVSRALQASVSLTASEDANDLLPLLLLIQ